MRRIALLAACLTVVTSSAAAQTIEDCYDCVLGIWDDAALTHPFGAFFAFQVKTLYLGVHVTPQSRSYRGLEFSVTGLRTEDDNLVLSSDPIDPANIILGTLQAPADTSAASTGTGGLIVDWPNSFTGDRALVAIQVLPLGEHQNALIQVKHRYPPVSPDYHTPVLVQWESPQGYPYTVTRVTGGCYIENPVDYLPLPPCNGGVPVAVESVPWSAIKRLYR